MTPWGWAGSATGDIKMTEDGGDTWTDRPDILHNLNRFRKVNDSIAYAVGNQVWKYSKTAVGLPSAPEVPAVSFTSLSPNPFKDHVDIGYSLPETGEVSLSVYDFAGRPIGVVHRAVEAAGTHSFRWDVPYYFDTHFFVVLSFKGHRISRKILCIQ